MLSLLQELDLMMKVKKIWLPFFASKVGHSVQALAMFIKDEALNMNDEITA